MEIVLQKCADGSLRPVDQEGIEQLARLKTGAGIRCKVTLPRNFKFLKKTMCLFTLAYEHFCEFGISEVEYKGRKVVPCKETFRKNLTVLAGHYDPVFDIRGQVRLVPRSLSFGKCTEEEAGKIYQDVITAALANVYRATDMTPAQLDARVNQILNFA
ncbi:MULTISPECIES: DUF1367 family protein [Pseudomonas]|uniref:Uncharacterized protein n=1 Tax=Pseudomonas lutea TaxID=243924 RepID=A0A9X8QLR5_9PSED|nr:MULTISPECIES: DUF1367 family protein [Pseudomonas]SER37216.1 Protein of unknown function [Pseudomonas lutea]